MISSKHAAIPVAALLLLVPLAGCLGGTGGGSSVPTEDGDGTGDGDQTDGDGPDPNGNGSTEAGDQPHVHPRWDDPQTIEYDEFEQITIVDREFELDPESQGCRHGSTAQGGRRAPPYLVCRGAVEFGPGTWSDGTPHIVPPGTSNVTITVDWGSDSDVHGVNVFYRHAFNKAGQWEGPVPGSPIQEAGTELGIRVPKTEWTDNGHAEESRWRFAVEAYGSPGPVDNEQVRWADGSVDVKIVAHRKEGELPLEPAHPDYWAETETYQLSYVEGSTGQVVQVGTVDATQSSADVDTNRPGTIWMLEPGFVGYQWDAADTPSTIPALDVNHSMSAVPPESQLLVGTLEVSSVDVQGPAEICFLESQEPANRWQNTAPVDECRSLSDGTYTFERSLGPEETDTLYAGAPNTTVGTAYTFFFQIRAERQAGQSTAAAYSADIEASVFVTKATEFTMPSWAKGPGS